MVRTAPVVSVSCAVNGATPLAPRVSHSLDLTCLSVLTAVILRISFRMLGFVFFLGTRSACFAPRTRCVVHTYTRGGIRRLKNDDRGWPLVHDTRLLQYNSRDTDEKELRGRPHHVPASAACFASSSRQLHSYLQKHSSLLSFWARCCAIVSICPPVPQRL